MMKRGMTLDGIIVICVVLLCVICVAAYMKRENTDYANVVDLSTTLKGAVKSVEDQQKKLREDQEKFAFQTTELLVALTKRVEGLNDKPKQEAIKLTLTEPIKVSLVYRKSEPKVAVAEPNVTHPGPLLKRAGIPPRVNQ